jgi:hypothetical protein
LNCALARHSPTDATFDLHALSPVYKSRSGTWLSDLVVLLAIALLNLEQAKKIHLPEENSEASASLRLAVLRLITEEY